MDKLETGSTVCLYYGGGYTASATLVVNIEITEKGYIAHSHAFSEWEGPRETALDLPAGFFAGKSEEALVAALLENGVIPDFIQSSLRLRLIPHAVDALRRYDGERKTV